MDEKQLNELIDKCLAGKATDEEQQMLDDWYASFENKKGLTEQLDETEKKSTADRILYGINTSIHKSPVSSRKKYIPLIAAASLLLLVASWFIYNNTGKSNDREAIVWVEVKGSSGKIRKDTLPDGSVVRINGNGSLRYHKNFNSSKREIWLTGEGYFDVVRQPDHPFIVYAGKVSAHVLGTEFNVKSGTGSRIVVTVTRGRVAVENDNKVLGVLGINEQIFYDMKSGEFQQSKIDALAAVSWVREGFTFREKPFLEIASILEKKFNISVVFTNPAIQHCLLTASFNADVSAKDMLTMLCKINGFQLLSTKNSFIISGRPCNK